MPSSSSNSSKLQPKQLQPDPSSQPCHSTRLIQPQLPNRGRRANRVARWSTAVASIAALSLILAFASAPAAALSFQVDVVNSTYDTQPGDTFSSLLAQHAAGSVIQSTTTQGLENISTAVYAGGVTRDYSLLLTTTFDLAVSGTYTFQVGTDWGRGGATALIDRTTNTILSETVLDRDIWWAYDWNNPDVFTTTFALNAGDSLMLQWVGFEGCCGGSTTLRFSVDGGAFTPFTSANFSSFASVPEPGTGLLLGLGLACLARRTRRDAASLVPSSDRG